jgi:hypothetical protein
MMSKKKLLSQYSTRKLRVYSIPQALAISIIGVRFTGGGHTFVYSQIPEGEIWIAEELMRSVQGHIPEGKFYIYHELYEHRKMAMGMSYDDAHLLANKVEGRARQGTEKELDELIKLEMIRNNQFISERSHFNGTLNLHKDGKLHHLYHMKKQHNEPNRLSTIR